jgi:hypothetical protein
LLSSEEWNMNPYLPLAPAAAPPYHMLAKASAERANEVSHKAQAALMAAVKAVDFRAPPTAKKAESALLAAEAWDRAADQTYATALAWQTLNGRVQMDWDATPEARAAKRTDKLCEDICEAAPWRRANKRNRQW